MQSIPRSRNKQPHGQCSIWFTLCVTVTASEPAWCSWIWGWWEDWNNEEAEHRGAELGVLCTARGLLETAARALASPREWGGSGWLGMRVMRSCVLSRKLHLWASCSEGKAAAPGWAHLRHHLEQLHWTLEQLFPTKDRHQHHLAAERRPRVNSPSRTCL